MANRRINQVSPGQIYGGAALTALAAAGVRHGNLRQATDPQEGGLGLTNANKLRTWDASGNLLDFRVPVAQTALPFAQTIPRRAQAEMVAYGMHRVSYQRPRLFQPTNLATVTLSNTIVSLSWTAALNASAYEYRYAAMTHPTGAWTSTPSTAVRLTGLSRDTPYQIQVRATGGFDFSESSPESVTARTFDYDYGEYVPARNIALDSANSASNAIWASAEIIYVANATTHRLFAYDLRTGARRSGLDVTLSGYTTGNGVRHEGGIWSDGATLWATSALQGFGGNRGIQAFSLATGARDDDADFAYFGASLARGLWCDGETFFISDSAGNYSAQPRRVYCYDLATGDRNISKEFNMGPGPGTGPLAPKGITSDGTTAWIVSGRGVAAYQLSDGEPQPGSEIDWSISNPANGSPDALTYRDGFLFTNDAVDEIIYAYYVG